jgi:hypothetical protein
MPYKRFYIKAHPGDWAAQGTFSELGFIYLFIPAYLLHIGLGLGGG